MAVTEARQTPRAIIDGLAYIKIEPNNGGIVLNVSEGGLCFHSIAPVQPDKSIRFRFSEHNHRVEAEGKLAWADETRTTAGLRFTALPAEALEQIHTWITQSATALLDEPSSALSIPSPRPSPVSATRPSGLNAAPGPEAKAPTPWTGFSRGLATGLLVSALVAAAFLFHAYRRQFGESLIHLGERLALKPPAQAQKESRPAETLLLAAPMKSPVPAPVRSPQPEKLLLQPPANPPAPQPIRIEPAQSATANPAAVQPPPVAGSLPPATLPTISLPAAGIEPRLMIPPPSPSVHASDRVEDSPRQNAASTPPMYFEVGKFKEQADVERTTSRLRQLGLHATVIEKGRLWRKSHLVLVGPYTHDEEADTAFRNLVSRGFKPRAFQRGSRNFTLSSPLTLNGAPMPVGDWQISWESYVPSATVKFAQDNNVVATADGKWVKRGIRYERDRYVYRKNNDGSRTLLEIWFAGMNQALVFRNPSNCQESSSCQTESE
jgi:hypothetical protein